MSSAIESKREVPPFSEWRFVKKDKDGNPVFRRNTNETAEFVASVLNDKNIPFVFQESGSCFRIYNEQNCKNYQYYHTTGRWGVYNGHTRPSKHYHSRSIKDFLERFFLKTNKDTHWTELVSKDGSDTSIEAAKTVDANNLEERVLDVIKSFPNGCIQDDVLNVLKDLPYSSVTARFAALKRKGFIEKTEEKRVGLSGSKQSVLKAKKE